jgi:flagellar capping protein FliD
MIAKYAAMESMLNTLQSQQSWLSSQISSLTGNK